MDRFAWPTSSFTQVGEAQQVRRFKNPIQPFQGSTTEESGTASAQEAPVKSQSHPWNEEKTPKSRESLSPDQAMEAAHARVVKLRGVLATLGEDDDMFPAMIVLKKAEAKAQEWPVSERIRSTKSFVERKQKRVDKAKETVVRAKEALAVAVADQEQQEVLLTDGQRRLAELQQEEKAMPSPFKLDPQHVVPDVAEFKRMQDTIIRLQRELASLRSVDSVDPTVDDDESLVVDLPHKKSRVGPTTLLGTSMGVPRTPLAITGGHGQGSSGLHPM